MKSMVEIREELIKENEKNLKEISEWVEHVIARCAGRGDNSVSFYPEEFRGFEAEMKVEAEKAGYKVESVENSWETGLFKKVRHTQRKVHVYWGQENV